jgi:hypothetical protein
MRQKRQLLISLVYDVGGLLANKLHGAPVTIIPTLNHGEPCRHHRADRCVCAGNKDAACKEATTGSNCGGEEWRERNLHIGDEIRNDKGERSCRVRQ